jgi:hypothetical protein
LRDNIIAGSIIVPLYVYLPLEQETFLDLRVIMLGARSTRFHAEQSGTLAGGRVDAQHLQLYTRRDIEPYTLRSATRQRGSPANTTLNRWPRGNWWRLRRDLLQQRRQSARPSVDGASKVWLVPHAPLHRHELVGLERSEHKLAR